MATRQIPERFFWVCDRCGKEEEAATGRPRDWGVVILRKSMSVPPEELDICSGCVTAVGEVIGAGKGPG